MVLALFLSIPKIQGIANQGTITGRRVIGPSIAGLSIHWPRTGRSGAHLHVQAARFADAQCS